MMEDKIEKRYQKMKKDAEASGYRLNPDTDFVGELLAGLLTNEDRYGYAACPCRLASGVSSEDLDIVCPCDYRDDDLNEYGACYCALYVSDAVAKGEASISSIPDRRPPGDPGGKETASYNPSGAALPYPVWRCKVCGYLCARDEAPGVCPICKAKKERFERFM